MIKTNIDITKKPTDEQIKMLNTASKKRLHLMMIARNSRKMNCSNSKKYQKKEVLIGESRP